MVDADLSSPADEEEVTEIREVTSFETVTATTATTVVVSGRPSLAWGALLVAGGLVLGLGTSALARSGVRIARGPAETPTTLEAPVVAVSFGPTALPPPAPPRETVMASTPTPVVARPLPAAPAKVAKPSSDEDEKPKLDVDDETRKAIEALRRAQAASTRTFGEK